MDNADRFVDSTYRLVCLSQCEGGERRTPRHVRLYERCDGKLDPWTLGEILSKKLVWKLGLCRDHLLEIRNRKSRIAGAEFEQTR